MASKRPVVLLILDGWGLGSDTKGNAITHANTPLINKLVKTYPTTRLEASGKAVGLPPIQSGNSEAGHMNIGAGRIVEQDAVIVSKAINTGVFFKNPAFESAHHHILKHKSQLHIMGLISDGNSGHSEPDHLIGLLSWARRKKIKNVYLHLFTDGRDSSPHSGLKLVEALMRQLKNKEEKGTRTGEWIATITGRFYAMDRKKEWSRTEATYNAMVLGKGRYAKSPQAAITEAYNRNETDEYIPPYVIKRKGKPIATIKDNDAVIFFNLRSDRARQMSKPFVQKNFVEQNLGSFKQKKILNNLLFVAMTDFGPDLDHIITAFPSQDIEQTLPAVLKNKKQLYIAEKEKYAHITYFFNGGYSDPIGGENRILVNSPNVEHYEETPSMSTAKITTHVIKELKNYDFIAINFAIPDMVAHTGNLKATIKACEAVDKNLKKIFDEIKKIKGVLIITADHGNAEKMLDEITGEMYTEHTTNSVPFIIIGSNFKGKLKKGKLSDVAPTILKVIGVKKPKEMTGKPLY